MSSKKRRNRQPATEPTTHAPAVRPRWPLAALAVVIGIGVVWTTSSRRSAPAPDAAAAAGPPVATPPVAAQPAAVEPLPARVPTDEELPPLPYAGYPTPRPLEAVQAAYRFAAQHPEVMRYVPCYCGCERSGHVDNEDCFVSARDANGQVTWSAHGLG